MGQMMADMALLEKQSPGGSVANRIFYFAIPPNVFLDTAASIKQVGVSSSGFTRLVVEKPFGHDYDSALKVRSCPALVACLTATPRRVSWLALWVAMCSACTTYSGSGKRLRPAVVEDVMHPCIACALRRSCLLLLWCSWWFAADG